MSTVTSLVLVSIGNTRARVAVARAAGGEFGAGQGSVEPSVVTENGAAGALEEALGDALAGVEPSRSRVLLASVAEAQVARVHGVLRTHGAGEGEGGWSVVRLGSGAGMMRPPLVANLEGGAAATVGVDRLLCALAAAHRSGGQPCAVIDAGTCLTVDFVDGFGVFQGGAIAPGVGLMLGSMHAGAPALPALTPPRKGDDLSWMDGPEVMGAAGKSTRQAMTLGALNAARGLVRWQVEKFAELAGRYPRVIATGGDAPLLFEGDDLVEHVVPDLQLVGMVAAWGIVQGGGDESGQGEEDLPETDGE